MDDAALLQRYAQSRSEPAFAELVRRHVDLVFSAALRQVDGDRHRAQEVTQMVFISLARKASSLARHPALLAWLHRSTRFAAANLRRDEYRRRAHEQAAATDRGLTGAAGEPGDWERLRPMLDEAVNDLNRPDREAVLLRFFANRPFAEVGRSLGVSENAARMRVERALAKLQAGLARRGITSTAAALAITLSGNAVLAAPAGAAAAAAGAALSATAGGSGIVLLHLMSSLKLQAGLAGALLAAGTTTVLLQQRVQARLRSEIAAVSQESGISDLAQGMEHIGTLRTENRKLAESATAAAALREATAEVERLRGEARNLAVRETTLAKGRSPGPSVLPAGTYPPSKLDQQPVALQQPPPRFPPEMKTLGMSGQAVIEFTIQADGSVSDLKEIKSSNPAFAESAMTAIKQWRYTPGQVGGQPVGAGCRFR